MNDAQLEEPTIRDYVGVLFRQKKVVMATILIVCVTVFIGLKFKTPVYESHVKMLIVAEKQVEATYLKELYAGGKAEQTLTQSQIVKSNPVLERVVRALALDKRPLDDEKKFCSPLKALLIDFRTGLLQKRLDTLPEEHRRAFLFRNAVESLKNNIEVEPIRGTNLFTITVRDYNPVGAALIANVVSRSYVMFDLEQQLAELKLKYGEKHPTVKLIEGILADLDDTLDGRPIDDVEAIGPASVKIMEQASVAVRPSGRSKALVFALAVMMSLFLAVVTAFVAESGDQTIKSPQEVRNFLDLPLIGSVPRFRFKNKRLIKDHKVTSAHFQSYRALAEQMCLIFKNERRHVLSVTSVAANEESAKVVADVGYYLARALRHKTLIIDADMRRSSMSRMLKIGPTEGLAAYLDRRAGLDEIIQKSREGGADIIPSGSTDKNPLTLLESQQMRMLFKDVVREYEMVLVHCANVGEYKDALVLAALVDGTILTIDAGRTRRQVAQAACAQFQEHHAEIRGVILVNRTFPIPKFVYDRV